MWPTWRGVSKKACGVNEARYAKKATSQKGTLPSARLCTKTKKKVLLKKDNSCHYICY